MEEKSDGVGKDGGEGGVAAGSERAVVMVKQLEFGTTRPLCVFRTEFQFRRLVSACHGPPPPSATAFNRGFRHS